jgi:hypothetical protein
MHTYGYIWGYRRRRTAPGHTGRQETCTSTAAPVAVGHIAEEVNLLFSIPLASFNRSGRCDDDRFHWKRVGAAVPASRPPVSVSRVHWWMPLFFSAPRAWLR